MRPRGEKKAMTKVMFFDHKFRMFCSSNTCTFFTVRTVGRSNGRTVGRTVGRTDGRTVGRTVGRTDGRTDGRTVGRTVGRSDGRTVGRSDGRSDGRTVGRTDGRKPREFTGSYDVCRTEMAKSIVKLHGSLPNSFNY